MRARPKRLWRAVPVERIEEEASACLQRHSSVEPETHAASHGHMIEPLPPLFNVTSSSDASSRNSGFTKGFFFFMTLTPEQRRMVNQKAFAANPIPLDQVQLVHYNSLSGNHL